MLLWLKKHTREILLVVEAFFATTAFFCDKTVIVSRIGEMEQFLLPSIGMIPILVFAAITVLFFYLRKRVELNVPQKIASLVAALMFSTFSLVGLSLNQDGSLCYWGTRGVYPKIVLFILIFGFTSILYETVKWVIWFFKKTDGIAREGALSKTGKTLRISFFKTFSLCTVGWSLYYILFFPGVVTRDTYYSINQALGFIPLTNENPFLHTLLEAVFLKPIFTLTGKVEIGIAVFVAFQLLVNAAIVAFSYVTLVQLQVKKIWRYGFVLFYATVPLIGIYTVTMWKDIWMASMVLLLSVLLVRYLYLNRRAWWNYLWIGIVCFCVFAAKGTGIIMVVFALVGLIFPLKKHWYKILITFVLAILCYYGVQTVAIRQFDVIPGHTRETKSVFLQQIARVVKCHGDDLTQYEKETIDEVLPYDRLAELYDPTISDPVKGQMNEEQYKKDPWKYMKLWASLGVKYPITYVASFAANTYGYWWPDVEYWTFSSSISYRYMLKISQDNGDTIYDPAIDTYDLSEESFVFRTKATEFFDVIEQFPVVSFFTCIALYFWGYLLLFISSFGKRDFRVMPFLWIGAGVFFSCIMSPVFAEMRYAYPAIFLFPMVVVLCKIPVCPKNETAPSAKELRPR